MNTSDVIVEATMAVAIVKGLVDLIRMCWGGNRDHLPPHWVPPIAALLLGPGVIALLNLSVGANLTEPATIGKVLLAGFMATLSAIGVTELHNQASPLAPSLVTPVTPQAPVMAVPTEQMAGPPPTATPLAQSTVPPPMRH